ncbi:hypothetical protein VTJ83DRAFT_4556 [Remersonia thermophila]|uniref:Mitochondrial fission process protein 1 n=1 Tax=Remersonia thermophila TaxID=72144 RepID=A0ABR4DA90_9PEZI
MWPWSSGSDKPAGPSAVPGGASQQQRPEATPSKVPDQTKLPPRLKELVDKQDSEENIFDEVFEGYAPPSTDSNVRYAAYAARFRTILLSAHRYVAYTSDIGESFRPVAHPWLVRGAYGVSWAYILGDVGYEGYKAYLHNQRVLNPRLELSSRQQRILGLDAAEPSSEPLPAAAAAAEGALRAIPPLEDYRTVMVQRAIFQSVASMGLPAFTIHSIVKHSGRAMKGVKNAALRTWGPIGLGLSVVPFLPRIFDRPVENAVEWAFHKGFEAYGGHEAVGDAPLIGRERQLSERPKEKKD